MDLTKPYDKSFCPKSILKGLQFYYELLDKVNIQIYLKENFPIKRKDIQLSIDFLSSIPLDAQINNLCFSHPQLTLAMESMDVYTKLSKEELHYSETRIILFLDHLLLTATNTMLHHAKNEIPKAINTLPINEKVNYLIKNKYYYTQNEGSFPTRFVKEVTEYCDSLIEKYKEIRASAEANNLINDEVKRMVEQYLALVQDNIQSNDLVSPLRNRNFNEFILKLKRILLIPSFYDITLEDKERVFHIYLLGILQGRIDGYKITSNKESGFGRYDIALTPIEIDQIGVIIEIKKRGHNSNINNELNDALNQIEEKYYFTEMRNQGIKSFLQIAIVFEGLDPHIKHKNL